jgi:putative spermidine/putrescine transport system ATP-binding protein
VASVSGNVDRNQEAAMTTATDHTAPAVVELRGVSMSYGPVRVLDSLDLSARRGEMIALLGPSGSGKTTIVRILAGFLPPTAGQVLLNGRDVTHLAPHRRGVGVVFQSYALFPHMTVEENVNYPLKVRRVGRAQIERRTAEMLELVRLGDFAASRPRQLSGGQQQRVALARALAMGPDVLLLDEPLSNLDANLRRDVGEEIRRLQRTTETTAIMVTHDRHEAFAMADRIAVLRDGRIVQLGTPHEIYRRPTGRFMAEFVGQANLLPGRVITSADATVTVDCGFVKVAVLGRASAGDEALVLVRPEDVAILRPDEPDPDNVIMARVEESFYYGNFTTHTLSAGELRMTAHASGFGAGELPAGTQVRVGFPAASAYLVEGGRA